MRERQFDVQREVYQYLQRGLRSFNPRQVGNIQEAVRGLIQALGGVRTIRKHYRTREELDSHLANAEFTELLIRRRFRRDFMIALRNIPHIALNDDEYRGATVFEVVSGRIVEEIREQFLKAVFPHARLRPIDASDC